MKKFITYFTATIMTMAVFTGCNDSDKGKEISESASKSNSALQVIDEEIVPNAESDFQYREVTAEESAKDVGGIVITGYIGVSDNVVIPRTINGKQVVAIDPLAFCPYTEEELLRIQDVESESSGDERSLDLNKVLCKLTDIDDFNISVHWASLNEETTNKNLETYKQALSKITSISNITSVKLPTSIKFLGFGVFAFCTNLQSVEVYDMPSDKPLVIECKNAIFYACGNLEEVNFYPSNDGYGTDKEYVGCVNLKTVYLYPDKSGNVNLYYTLYSNKDIKEIYIADGTTSLSGSAGVGGMTGDTVEYSSSFIIYEYGVETIHLPFTLKSIGMHTFCTDTNESLGSFILGEEEPACNGIMNTNINIIAPAGSYAEQYAKEHGIMVNGVRHEIVKPTEKPDESESESSTEESESDKFMSAFSTAKSVFIAATRFAQMCDTVGKPLALADGEHTGVLTVNSSDPDTDKISNVVGATSDAPAVNAASKTEIQHAVNASLDEEDDGSKYIIVFNAEGFPKTVYWAKTDSDEIVGIYPPPQENEEKTIGGITKIAEEL